MSLPQYTSCFRRGNYLFFRGRKKDGSLYKKKILYKPFLFVEDSFGDYETIDGKKLRKKPLPDMRAAREAIESEDTKHYGQTDWVYQFLKGQYPNGIEYDLSLVDIAYLDIEVESSRGFPDPYKALSEVTAITLYWRGKYLVFGCCREYEVHRDDVVWFKCTDERDLLTTFMGIWGEMSPDVITGWNVDGFDIPYLYNRLHRLFGEEMADSLSPWGIIEKKQVSRFNRPVEVYDLKGMEVMDYLFHYRKFGKKTLDSYRLEAVGQEELGEGKVTYGEYGTLNDLYLNNPQLYIEYNVRDVEMIVRMERKMHILDVPMTIAYQYLMLFTDPAYATRVWDVIVTNHLYSQNIVVPFKDRNRTASAEVEGGYVKEPQVGYWKNVVSFDLNSLYPHIVMGTNISPDTIVGQYFDGSQRDVDKFLAGEMKEYEDKAKAENLCLAPSGCVFRRDRQGFFPVLLEKMYRERSEAKKAKQASEKDLELIKAEIARREKVAA